MSVDPRCCTKKRQSRKNYTGKYALTQWSYSHFLVSHTLVQNLTLLNTFLPSLLLRIRWMLPFSQVFSCFYSFSYLLLSWVIWFQATENVFFCNKAVQAIQNVFSRLSSFLSH